MSGSLYIQRKDLSRAKNDVNYLQDARAALLLDANPLAGISLILLVIILFTAYIWADNAIIDEVTVGQGRIVSSSREQVIQSLEGGILAELLVREGDVVEAGQILFRIDDTRSGAALREGQGKAATLRAAIGRLKAEAVGGRPVFPSDIPAKLIELEEKLYQSRRRTLQEALLALNRNVQLIEEELSMTEPLVAQGAVSEVEVLRLRRQLIEIKGKIQERSSTFKADARANLAAKEAELASISELNTAREDQFRRTIMRAPMRGTVKNVSVTTVGGVIRPGVSVMEIVPLEDKLFIEARIRPADVAFLRPGQTVMVKITAYDFSIYGGLAGQLTHISADTIPDEKDPNETYYRILVRTERTHLKGKEGPLPIIPGMIASVEILTGKKSILDYIFKPVLKVRNSALRER